MSFTFGIVKVCLAATKQATQGFLHVFVGCSGLRSVEWLSWASHNPVK